MRLFESGTRTFGKNIGHCIVPIKLQGQSHYNQEQIKYSSLLDIQKTVHHDIFLQKKVNEMHYFSNLFWHRTLHALDRSTVHHQ
jgi:hypothetical protein